ncbi:oxygen-independent coproporphyrinogen-III oxidase-like protein YqeR [Geobacter sp. OR-1]|uniref:radical SAM family heme chaperone HemW n=1 Tax=Geobacter sp. OR-1 TaxID=1266765 RepID=UPI0005442680|nr:radical SAM family heme chaperone HemW [Geobacter sp. OR-1]GAM08538.1 oxygen-independent coproporphyrinogen-III oxidase-like protein YqeR [Geobacter sp. OR-1]
MPYHFSVNLSLYIHIPFCVRKCLYCDFASSELPGVTHEEYVAAVVREMESRAKDLPEPAKTETMYIGGGTPSLLAPQLVEQLISAAQNHYHLAADAEITLEANPGTVTAESLAGYRSAGVNRLSIGVQSMDDAMLAILGRIHTAQQAREAVAIARQAGFDNIGIDLIHSLPGQTLDHWEQTLHDALALAPEHISVYGLTIEDGTPFAAMAESGEIALPAGDDSATMFEMAIALLPASSYEHYEIANFARPGRRSRHNQVYWRRGNYLGFGASAHSFLRAPGFGKRWSNTPDIGEFCRAGSSPHTGEDVEHLTKQDAMGESLFLGLRMLEGIDPEDFRNEYGESIDEAFPGVLDRHTGNGLLHKIGPRIALTGRGILLANLVFADFA